MWKQENKNNLKSHQKPSQNTSIYFFSVFYALNIHLRLHCRYCSDVKRICLQCRGPRFNPWVGKIPWRREWQPTPVLLPGEFHGQRRLAGYSPSGHKELDTTERLTHMMLCNMHFSPPSPLLGRPSWGFWRHLRMPLWPSSLWSWTVGAGVMLSPVGMASARG